MAYRIFVFVLVVSTTASAESISSRVIGGKDAEDNAFPYQVSIRVQGFHICGGSIINKQWILTAAHCLRNPIDTFVVVGSNSILSDKDIDETNCTAIFTGWGETKNTGGRDNWLQIINLKIVELPKCRMIYQSVKNTNICTDNSHTHGVCYGDSGSPLVLNGVQIGLASWVTPCAKGYPDVHTRIYSYIDWIISHIS
ncbi:chymotrypsin-1-like isoform X2 [Vespula pensylvanica]|uniref:chymotrypsin-1-like isoform X2 n=1 Tax=Vespula pensylvanica TaxID=30213 RepID=UPI001CBA4A18|nr:chymotrypsin-1-like isoform X2 [Vespula pensylvanica]